jgi:hypothetical protein
MITKFTNFEAIVLRRFSNAFEEVFYVHLQYLLQRFFLAFLDFLLGGQICNRFKLVMN